MTLNITHSKRDSEEHFQALGFDDSEPNMVIRFDYSTQEGWQKWRHGGWLPIAFSDVPVTVMAKYSASQLRAQESVGAALEKRLARVC